MGQFCSRGRCLEVTNYSKEVERTPKCCNDTGNRLGWQIRNSNLQFLEKYKVLCEKIYSDLQWKIARCPNQQYVLFPLTYMAHSYGNLLQRYRNMLQRGRGKRVPVEIINSNQIIRQSFWEGMLDSPRSRLYGSSETELICPKNGKRICMSK